MDYDYFTLMAFAHSFAGNWRQQAGFNWTRTDIGNPDQWGVIYTRTDKDTPVEIINAEHLHHLLWVYLNFKSKNPEAQKQIYKIPERELATGKREGYLLRAYYEDGTITNACATLYDHLSALREHPVADDVAFDKLEEEIFADEWPGILQSIVAEFDGEKHPFYDEDCTFYIDLRTLEDVSGISKLLLSQDPRNYWSSCTGYFDLPHFLYDITDGSISFAELFNACPETASPPISVIVTSIDDKESTNAQPFRPESDSALQPRQLQFQRRRVAE